MEWTLTGLPLPLILRPPSPFTDDDLLELSSQNDTFRIEKNEHGELVIMTPLGGTGGIWEAFVIRKLGAWAEEMGNGYVFSSNTGFNLSDGSTLSPDASWVSKSLWHTLLAQQRKGFPPLCPEFVIEILSASDSKTVLDRKMKSWVANGAQLAWMIDPYKATVTIYTPMQEPLILIRPDIVVGEEPIAGFELPVHALWTEQ